jgi:hypothetical protein
MNAVTVLLFVLRLRAPRACPRRARRVVTSTISVCRARGKTNTSLAWRLAPAAESDVPGAACIRSILVST